MNKYALNLIAALLISLPAIVANPAHAVSHPYEFHAGAGMVHAGHGPVKKAYGYMNVFTDEDGEGLIIVMFSNGSQINWARFNARVEFLDATGSVIKEEYFDRRIAAAGMQGAIERKVAKALTLSEFDSIRVDFYLSDIPDPE